ncbi:MAG: hypothetical protein L3J26_07080, partial [Candidatus Polarisedimenticolaceae bacterium]|nr:hypothetical protein [Candidatus Polarisedimenticolaceae bacterium]
LDGVSDAYAASPLAQGTTGMLRAAYAYCGLPAFVSLSMAGSERAGNIAYRCLFTSTKRLFYGLYFK